MAVGPQCERQMAHAANLNVQGLGALNIKTTKPDGGNWDFTNRSDRREAIDLADQ